MGVYFGDGFACFSAGCSVKMEKWGLMLQTGFLFCDVSSRGLGCLKAQNTKKKG